MTQQNVTNVSVVRWKVLFFQMWMCDFNEVQWGRIMVLKAFFKRPPSHMSFLSDWSRRPPEHNEAKAPLVKITSWLSIISVWWRFHFVFIFIYKFPPLDLPWCRDPLHVARDNRHAITRSLQPIAGDSWLISNDEPATCISPPLFSLSLDASISRPQLILLPLHWKLGCLVAIQTFGNIAAFPRPF